ncbi:MAG: hypothetical protein ABI867_03275 [Kofleriaceae bacterium]
MLVEVNARRFTIPFECPCCGAAPDAEMAIHLTRLPGRTVAPESARELAFPYCQRCIAHVTAWEAAGVVPAGVMLGGIIAGVVVGIAVHPGVGAGVLVAAAPAAWFLRQSNRAAAKRSLGPSCACPGRALAYLGWSGAESSFEFESHTYAARFAEQNPAITPNKSTQLQRLLEGHRVARLAVPTPAAAVHTVPPPATVADWIARIDGSNGAIARRTVLQRALDGLHDDRDRQQVIAAATRLELAPVFEEVEGLSPIAAKGRLQHAIEGVRADNIPEELQISVLGQLELRARSLG